MVLFNKKRNRMKIKDKILSETSEEVKQRVRDTANKLVMKQETLEEDFKIWDDLFGILAWKFKPTKSGDMYLDGEKVYEELKSKFKLKRI